MPKFISDDEMTKLEQSASAGPAPASAPSRKGFISDSEMSALEASEPISKKESGIRGAAQGATMGFADEITGAGQAFVDDMKRGFSGDQSGPKAKYDEFGRVSNADELNAAGTYKQRRDESRKNYRDAQTANPKTYAAGEFGGAVASTMLPGMAAAKGFSGAMKVGSAVGAASGLGASEAEDFKGMAKDTAFGAGAGLVGGVGGAAVEKGVAAAAPFIKKGVNAVGQKFSDLAENQAFRASGAMLKDYRSNDVKSAGRWILDNAGLKALDTFDDVAKKASAAKEQAGGRLDKVYSEAVDKFGEQLEKKGFNPTADREQILHSVREELGDSVGADAAVKKVAGYLDEVSARQNKKVLDRGPARPSDLNGTLDPKSANNVKTAIDNEINYARNPLTKDPAGETAFKGARKAVSQKVDESIESLGGDALLTELKAANREYGSAATVDRVAKDRVSREASNKQMFGLTDTIAAGAGLTYGASTDDWTGAVGIMAGKKAIEKYGASTLAVAADRIGKKLLSSPEAAQIAASNPTAFRATVINMARKVLDSPSEGIGQIAKPESEKPQERATPKKGPEKWASDGFEKVSQHAGNDLGLDRDQMMSDPKMKDLLIQASDLKPGTKAFENVVQKIQSRKGKS